MDEGDRFIGLSRVMGFTSREKLSPPFFSWYQELELRQKSVDLLQLTYFQTLDPVDVVLGTPENLLAT